MPIRACRHRFDIPKHVCVLQLLGCLFATRLLTIALQNGDAEMYVYMYSRDELTLVL